MTRPASAPSQNRHPLRGVLVFWLLVTVFLVCLSAGGGLGAFLGFLSRQSPIAKIEQYNPPLVTRVYEQRGERVVARFFDEKREILPQSEMPAHLKNAFIAMEDVRFYRHFGVDLLGLARAMLVNLKAGATKQGASTITQQLARNVLPKKVGWAKTVERKIREALVAFLIEQRYSKDQILEMYLNQIFLGHRAYGVQAAARTYFNKDARKLNLPESASLAAVPKSPSRVNPFTNPQKLIARRNLVLENMARAGFITPRQAEEAQEADLITTRSLAPRVEHPYFIDYLQRELAEDPRFHREKLLTEGYAIRTTMNERYQKIVEEEIRAGLPEVEKKWQSAKWRRLRRENEELLKSFNTLYPRKGQRRLAKIVEVRPDGVEVEIEGYRGFAPFYKDFERNSRGEKIWNGEYRKPWFFPEDVLKKGRLIDVVVGEVHREDKEMELRLYDTTHVQAAAVLLDVKTGQIRALSGGHSFYDMANNGMWNRATREPGRQPGSAFKPLLYATALARTPRTPATVIMDDRTEFGPEWNLYVPRNYENAYFGPTTLLEALAHSNNVVTVKLFSQMREKALEGYREFDFLEEKPQWDLGRGELSLCLGSLSVTPLSLASAYLALPRQGVAIAPTACIHVRNNQAERIYTPQPREKKILSPQAAYQMVYMMQEVVKSGTGRRMIGQYFDWEKTPPMAGKTGTTTAAVDAWFAGFTPELVLVVWVGFDKHRSLGPGMTGSRVAIPIWRGIMERVLAEREDWKMAFDQPDGIVFRDITSRTGMLPSTQAERSGESVFKNVPFAQGTEPREKSPGFWDFPYWSHQHPDPEKNTIASKEDVPEKLRLEWESKLQEEGVRLPDLERVWTEEAQDEMLFEVPDLIPGEGVMPPPELAPALPGNSYTVTTSPGQEGPSAEESEPANPDLFALPEL